MIYDEVLDLPAGDEVSELLQDLFALGGQNSQRIHDFWLGLVVGAEVEGIWLDRLD